MAQTVEMASKSAPPGAASSSSRTPETDRPAHARFTFRVENYLHIAAVYGRVVADTLLDEVGQLLAASLGENGIIRADRLAGGFTISNAYRCSAHHVGQQLAHDLKAFCTATTSRAFRCAGHRLHPILSWSRLSLDGELFSMPTEQLGFGGDAVRHEGDWVARYRRDMELAAGLLADIAEDRLFLQWQPIAPAGGDFGALFHEAIPCRMNARDGSASPLHEVEAAERVGLVRIFDRWSVSQAMRRLDAGAFPQLGVCISAQSAVVDGWWTDILAHLRRYPDQAQRLTLVISGATPFPSINDALKFVRQLRTLGCRIALDGFGVGFSSLRHLLALSPDMVRIDGLFVHWAEQSARDASMLHHAVQLAGATGATVVVNGIATKRQHALAIEAGARWLQGEFVGRSGLGFSRFSQARHHPQAAASEHHHHPEPSYRSASL
ncbi:EAL domain-containing protein [Sphingobium aquiterrae]|uniref:EAL domain-containing protein n=1 Tax=Sphingobium aquiterrae TaxID=2038656 RepID=UPI003015D246